MPAARSSVQTQQASLQHASDHRHSDVRAVRRNKDKRSFRELCAFTAGGKAAFAALEPAGNAIVHGLFRNFEPNR